MERSSKHSPKMDEQMKQETEPLERGSPGGGHTEDFRDMEPPVDDQPMPDARLRTANRASDRTLSDEEIEQRSMIAQLLDPSIFPAYPDEIVASARSHHPSDTVIALLESLPDQRYDNVQSIWEALGGNVEQRS